MLLVNELSAQVNIRVETARFYLEAEDERNLLRQKDTLQQQLISTLKEEIITKDKIEDTYKQEVSGLEFANVTLRQAFTLKSLENDKLKGKLRLRNLLDILLILGTFLILI